MVSLTPKLARFLLISAALVCAVGMIGPFKGVEKHLISVDKAAHFIAFYGLTLLTIAAFPKRRSFDLACLVLLFGVSIEVGQVLSGRGAQMGDVLADVAGVVAVLLPMHLQRLRSPPIVERRRRLADKLPAVEPQAPPETV
jgi:VanZ family protein